MKSPDHIVKTDVLIIGGGFSGLWAAISAREHVENVIMVDKGPLDWGGMGTAAGGDFQCVQDTTVEAALDDLVYYYDALCDQILIQRILKESYQRFQHFERLGVHFQRDEQGRLVSIPQRNLKHMKMLLVRPFGTGGPSMRDALVREIKRLDVKRMARIGITDILRDEQGNAAGAVGFHAQSGETFLFEAKAIVLATGNGGWRNSYVTNSTAVGEGSLLAYNAGAELSHNEFANIWIQPVLFSWEGQAALLPLGAHLVNNDGEDFMKKYYSPKLGSNTDTTYISRGMAFEARAGRQPFYFDTTAIEVDKAKLMEPVRGWAKNNYERLKKEYGLKFFGGKTRWMPQVMWHDGGPATNHDYETTIPGLFAACRCMGFDPGVYMGGWALCTTAVTGYISGGNAGRRALESMAAGVNPNRAAEDLAASMAPLWREGMPPKDLVRECQEIVFPAEVCLLKSEESLNRASERVDYALEIKSRLAARDPRELLKYHEACTMLMRAELFVKTSLLRRESRAGHYRVDYPERNNGDWLAWIYASKGPDGNPVFKKVPLPVEQYPIKPYRYYMDNFTFPRD